MSLEEFMKKYNLKSRYKVISWLENDLIPGSYRNNDGEWELSSLARPPYTQARAKNANSIYVSIVRACIKQRGVCAKLYNLTEEEFGVYITNLIQEGLITSKTDGNAVFYFATTKSNNYINDTNGLRKCIRELIEPIAYGVSKAAIEKAMSH